MVVDVAQMSRTWVQRAVQADLREVGRKLGEPSNKVSPTAAGAKGHRASTASRTRTRSDKKLQTVKDSSLTQGGRLLQAMARNGAEVGMQEVKCSNRHVKNPVKQKLPASIAMLRHILVETPRAGGRQGKESGRRERVIPRKVKSPSEEPSKGGPRGQKQPRQGSSPGPEVCGSRKSRFVRGGNTSVRSPGTSRGREGPTPLERRVHRRAALASQMRRVPAGTACSRVQPGTLSGNTTSTE